MATSQMLMPLRRFGSPTPPDFFGRQIVVEETLALFDLSLGPDHKKARKTLVYIVYMGDLPKGNVSASSNHMRMLKEVVGSRASESLLYSYKRSFNGFVAKLTKEEKDKIASMAGVVFVFPNEKKKLHTTRSWDFMGFPHGVKRSAHESDIIIGILDSGIWPESHSFNDTGYGPPRREWKGSCQSSTNFTCNKKIIGAKTYNTVGSIPQGDFDSPRDLNGHGTHTASTAAGSLVSRASLLGLGLGTARGGVPSACIAVYKVCWADGTRSTADILAAFDDAIADGVDIISISVGGSTAWDYFNDPIAIGAFHSMKKGVLTSNSAGNDGPYPETISNFSPWSLSVAASTIDRKFGTMVLLGNNKSYQVLHLRLIEDAGGIGTIMNDDEGSKDFAFSFPLPVSYLGSKDGRGVYHCINSTRKPTATIKKSIEAENKLAPYVASFSSRGANPITSDILKPDLTAPGVDIVTAWLQATTVTGIEGDKRVVPYDIISGTSMSCPHATGAVAYVKSFNPGWSPATIKSALMTTSN